MMRVVSLPALVLILLLIGCGSSSSVKEKICTAQDVESAFAQAGIPIRKALDRSSPSFAAEVAKVVPKAALKHLRAFLIAAPTRASAYEMAFVYDSAKSADAAANFGGPLDKWLSSHPNTGNKGDAVGGEIAGARNVLILLWPADSSTLDPVNRVLDELAPEFAPIQEPVTHS